MNNVIVPECNCGTCSVARRRVFMLYGAYESAPKPGCDLTVVMECDTFAPFERGVIAKLMRQKDPGATAWDCMCEERSDSQETALQELGNKLASYVESNYNALGVAAESHLARSAAALVECENYNALRNAAHTRRRRLAETFAKTEGQHLAPVRRTADEHEEECD